jgi:hypothetical protein
LPGTPARERGRGFAPEEMVVCDACLRANPPTRAGCFYCGARLPVNERSAALRRPTLKPLEEWERGFNVVLLPSESGVTPEALGGAASLLRLEPERVRAMAEAGVALPLARAASEEEADLVVERMRAQGFRVEVFADDELAAASLPPRRARALEFGDEALACRATLGGEPERVAWSDLLLFVAGRVFTKRVEVEEQRGRLGARSEIVEARELRRDEAVLDIYTARDDGRAGWRVAAEGFDYTCLGQRKGLLAAQNFLTLTRLLRERAPAAHFDEGYARVRHLLQTAWPLAERTEAQGVRRAGAGRLNTEAVTVVGNDAQFTRYSRLRWRLALRRAQG